jgi:hypothetical protein
LLNDKDAKLRLSVFNVMTLEKELEKTRGELANMKQVSTEHPRFLDTYVNFRRTKS